MKKKKLENLHVQSGKYEHNIQNYRMKIVN